MSLSCIFWTSFVNGWCPEEQCWTLAWLGLVDAIPNWFIQACSRMDCQAILMAMAFVTVQFHSASLSGNLYPISLRHFHESFSMDPTVTSAPD